MDEEDSSEDLVTPPGPPLRKTHHRVAMVEECGGDKTKIDVSHATADRSRRKVAEQIATAIREEQTRM